MNSNNRLEAMTTASFASDSSPFLDKYEINEDLEILGEVSTPRNLSLLGDSHDSAGVSEQGEWRVLRS